MPRAAPVTSATRPASFTRRVPGAAASTRSATRGGGFGNRFSVAAELELRDLVAVYFVGPVSQTQRARARVRIGEAEIVG